jgi:penicillin-binding protein 2
VVERIESPGGQVIEEFPPRSRRDVSVSVESLNLVRRALYGVVNETKGTAFKARSEKIEVAGKTGTAQIWAPRHRDEGGQPYEKQYHAWFAGFAPAARPKIAFAVIVERGGRGAEVAAPVAMQMVDGYFDQVAPPEERDPPKMVRDLPRHARRARAP